MSTPTIDHCNCNRSQSLLSGLVTFLTIFVGYSIEDPTRTWSDTEVITFTRAADSFCWSSHDVIDQLMCSCAAPGDIRDLYRSCPGQSGWLWFDPRWRAMVVPINHFSISPVLLHIGIERRLSAPALYLTRSPPLCRLCGSQHYRAELFFITITVT